MQGLANFLKWLPTRINNFALNGPTKHQKWFMRSLVIMVLLLICPICLVVVYFLDYRVVAEIFLVITVLEIPLLFRINAQEGNKKARELLQIIPYISNILLGINASTLLMPINSTLKCVLKGDNFIVLLIYVFEILDYIFRHLNDNKIKKNINNPYVSIRRKKLQCLEENQKPSQYYLMDQYGRYKKHYEYKC